MASELSAKGKDKEYGRHLNNYEGFVSLLKVSIVVVAIVTAIVLYVIAN